ncbi:hypothetical protein [Niabella aurantiaca]|nr:hypothetical protein [Niabella aurantiaca]
MHFRYLLLVLSFVWLLPTACRDPHKEAINYLASLTVIKLQAKKASP